MALTGLAKWPMPNLRQDYLGTSVLKFRLDSSLSFCAKTIHRTKFLHPRLSGWSEAFILVCSPQLVC